MFTKINTLSFTPNTHYDMSNVIFENLSQYVKLNKLQDNINNLLKLAIMSKIITPILYIMLSISSLAQMKDFSTFRVHANSMILATVLYVLLGLKCYLLKYY